MTFDPFTAVPGELATENADALAVLAKNKPQAKARRTRTLSE